jgi:hypothetical protein
MTFVPIAAEITREAKCFRIDVGDVVFEYHNVLISDFFIRTLAPEFSLTVVVLAVNRSEDDYCYRDSY